MSVPSWSTDPNANTTVGGINIAENCPAGNINGALREMMAEIKVYADSLPASLQPLSAKLTALANLTLAADQLIYATGATSLATASLTPFMRTLLDDPDQATALQTLGAIKVAALSLANPGYIRIQVGASSFLQLAWGTFSASPNGYTGVNYAASFPNASFPVVSGAAIGAGAQDNNPETAGGSATTSGFQAYSAADGAVPCYYIAAGY